MSKSKMRKTGPMVPERAVVAKYIRVSTDKQREEGYSVDIQKERLAAYTRSMFPTGADVTYLEYVDDGWSGGSLDRPQMTKLIEDVKAGRVTHVVVVKLDRLSRSQKDTLYLIEDVFLPHNVAFISMGESFNTATAFGRAVVGILSVFAQLERENIFERTRGGMQKRVELGYWPGGGRVPFGYDYDPKEGILVPNGDAPTVRRAYELYLQGWSCQAIADVLGLKYEKLAQQILKRKSNTGVIVYNGVEYPGRHQPIVSKETYDRAMLMMAERGAKRFVSPTEHLLTGLVYCGCCGGKMRYQKWGKAGERLVCYSQQRSKPYLVRDPDCPNARPWAEEVEGAVLDILFRRAGEKMTSDGDRSPTQAVTELLEAQRREAARKLSRLYDLYAAGEDDVLTDAIQRAKKDLAEVDKKLALEERQEAVSAALRETQAKLETLEECWPYMTLREKQTSLRSVLERVVVNGDHVHVDFKA